MKFRKHFDYDVDKASADAAVLIEGPSLTVQSMAEDADLNVLMDRFGITGRMPENPRVPKYGDFTSVKDYQSALNAVMEASDKFMELPAKVRARFNNDPQELLAFVSDDANIEEAQKLGFLKESFDGSRSGGKSRDVSGSGRPAAEAGRTESGDASGVSAGPTGRQEASGK